MHGSCAMKREATLEGSGKNWDAGCVWSVRRVVTLPLAPICARLCARHTFVVPPLTYCYVPFHAR